MVAEPTRRCTYYEDQASVGVTAARSRGRAPIARLLG
jgi:hypothetical protein